MSAVAGSASGAASRGTGATGEALASATDALVAAGVPEARLDAELLLAHASGRGRASLIADPGAMLPPAVGRLYGELVRQAAAAGAARLHRRVERLPPDRARGRPPRVGPAAGDRAAGRSGAGASAGPGPRRRHRLGGDRPRGRRRAARGGGRRHRHLARGAGSGARERGAPRPRRPGPLRGRDAAGGRGLRPPPRQPSLRRRKRLGGARARGDRVGAARGAALRVPTGSTTTASCWRRWPRDRRSACGRPSATPRGRSTRSARSRSRSARARRSRWPN